MHTSITSSFANDKRLYCAFIDLKKHFTLFIRETCQILVSKEKLVRVIKGLYKNVKARTCMYAYDIVIFLIADLQFLLNHLLYHFNKCK